MERTVRTVGVGRWCSVITNYAKYAVRGEIYVVLPFIKIEEAL